MKIWVLLILTSSLILWPLTHRGLPPSHDAETHIIRAYQFDKTLRDGDWYPRWQPDVNKGYGSPLLNYSYPLPYYVISIFHFFGFSFIDGFKLALAFATITGGIVFFLWARIFWGNLGGLVSSTVYTFSPYHIVDLYVRGALGEIWSLALFPGFLWAVTMLIKKKNVNFFVPSALFLGLLILSHNILAYMFFPFAIAYCVVITMISGETKKSFIYVSSLMLLGLGISGIFWIPALFEKEFVRGLLVYNIYEHFPEVYQLIFPSWGTGFSNTDLSNQMSFQIGVVNILAVLTNIFISLQLFKKNIKDAVIIIFFLIVFFVVMFFLMNVSYPVWKYAPFLNYFQFPWRFLSLEILISAFLSGSILKFWNVRVFGYILVLVTVLLTIGYIAPSYYWEREDSYYFSRPNFMDGTNISGNIFNTIWFDEELKKQKEKIVIISGHGTVSDLSIKSTKYVFTLIAQTPLAVQVKTAYFPGWEVKVDKKTTAIHKTKEGLFVFDISSGKHLVEVKFTNTPIRKAATFVSLASLTILFLFSRGLFDRMKR